MQPLRKRIVTAAEAICLREGAARMSMRKVAGEVGVSAAAIYRHFENRQALLNEIVVVGLRSLGTYLRPALEAGRPMWGTFRLAVEQISQCMERGVLQRDDPLSTAILIWAQAYGLILLYRTGRLGDDVEAFRRLYGDSLDRLLARMRPPDA